MTKDNLNKYAWSGIDDWIKKRNSKIAPPPERMGD